MSRKNGAISTKRIQMLSPPPCGKNQETTQIGNGPTRGQDETTRKSWPTLKRTTSTRGVTWEALAQAFESTRRNTNAPLGTPELECFLKKVEERILAATIDQCEKNKARETAESKEVKELAKTLAANSDLVVVPTDKTNSFVTMDKSQYVSGGAKTP